MNPDEGEIAQIQLQGKWLTLVTSFNQIKLYEIIDSNVSFKTAFSVGSVNSRVITAKANSSGQTIAALVNIGTIQSNYNLSLVDSQPRLVVYSVSEETCTPFQIDELTVLSWN